MRFSSLALLGAISLGSIASAFYLPGVAPADYSIGDSVLLYVNRLTPSTDSKDQHLHSLIPFDYYHPLLNFCRPEDGPKKVSESLGSILFGDRILTSPFKINMAKNETCKLLCKTQKYNKHQAEFVGRRIKQNYNINWLIDGLPAATAATDNAGNVYLRRGFPLGIIDKDDDRDLTPFFNNHYDILIDYHQLSTSRGMPRYRVVGVTVQPSSRQSSEDTKATFGANCDNEHQVFLNTKQTTDVVFTYSVYWRPSKTAWATRWDKYLNVPDTKIHWFSLANSAIFVVLLSSMVVTVLLRALRKDITRYNQLDLDEDVQDDSGWKLVHGDVFRPPKNPMLLSIFLGSGVQLFFMAGITIVFALLGFLSPSNRGSLGTVMILLYTLFGFVGGYVSARAYKTLGGEAWKRNILFTPVLIPGIVFATFFFLNLFLFFQQSSGAVPFGTMLALISIWFVISVPLSFAGSWVGFRALALESPVRTNQIPRQIPPSVTYLRPIPSMFLAGILPFGAIFVELYFIMDSIWFNQVYYMFGFLFVVYGIMVLRCAPSLAFKC
jgi:transmembrane 9 superfamily protein 2/4